MMATLDNDSDTEEEDVVVESNSSDDDDKSSTSSDSFSAEVVFKYTQNIIATFGKLHKMMFINN